MAEYGSQITQPTMQASGNLSGVQYHIVRQLGANRCSIGSLATDVNLIGVLQNVPQNDEAATICSIGASKVVAGASATVGALFTTNGSGRAIATTSGAVIVGRFLEAPGADGDIVSSFVFAVGGKTNA